MSNERIYLSPPHMSGEEIKLIEEVFKSNWIAPLGPMVDRFEDDMVAFTGTGAALATSSATAAIHLALVLCGVKAGDTVLCSSFTFIGSANPVLYLGAEPVFIDSEPETWNMSPDALEKAMVSYSEKGRLPRAVIVVNLYGQSADYGRINEICRRYGVPVIEDAAESLGAEYQGKPSGTLGDYGIFSFNGNKIITTSGGGMLIAGDPEAVKKARYYATQSREPVPWYEHTEVGYNYRMSNILAAVGCAQLQCLGSRLASKRRIAEYYKARLGDVAGVAFIPEASVGISNHWLTVITVDTSISVKNALEIISYMEKQNIEARPVWKPMHLQPVFKDCQYFGHYENVSCCDDLFYRGICLPSGSSLSEQQLDRVCDTLLTCLEL